MLQPDSEQRFLMLMLPVRSADKPPLTLLTRDLDTDESLCLHVNRETHTRLLFWIIVSSDVCTDAF